MFEVMKGAAIVHKIYGPPSKWIGAQDALSMCLKGGAKLMRKKIGSLQPGYLADIVILGMDRLFMLPKENFINQLVYSDLGFSVETVLVDGAVVIEDKELKTINERELRAEAAEGIEKLHRDFPNIKKQIAPALDLLERMAQAAAEYKISFNRLANL